MEHDSKFGEMITSEAEIRTLIGNPSELVKRKVIARLDDNCIRFLSQSPLLFLATSDEAGHCDVSPRGDAPGFVHVLDARRFIIPERPGNRRIDSLRNILANGHAGVIFIIPGLEETLRVNGRACIVKDRALLEPMKANGNSPVLGIGITVEECFIHCAKAFKRSTLWNPASWPAEEELPSAAQMLAAHARGNADDIARSLQESYTKRLY